MNAHRKKLSCNENEHLDLKLGHTIVNLTS